MKSPPPVPRFVIALLECLVPPERRAEALGDLCEEYGHIRGGVGRWRAAGWLARESASLARAWALARVERMFRARTIVRRDARLAWRALAQRPLTAVSAAAMLGLGVVSVGLSWALGYALLDRPVSQAHGDRVRRIAAVESSGRLQSRFSAVEFEAIDAALGSGARVGAGGLEPALVRAGGRRRQTLAEIVSPAYADVVGMTLQAGRALLTFDHEPGAAPAAVISDVLWRQLFDRSPSALNASLFVNGRAFAIVGVARPGPPSSFLGASVDVWLPLAQGDVFFSPGWRTDVARRSLSLFVLPEISQPALHQHLARAGSDLTARHPDAWRQRSLTLVPGTAVLGTQRAAAQQLSRILLALAVLILAVAGANAGGLLLAGAAARRREAAIDMAIGAGPGAAPRRLLVEGALLGIAAGGLAWLLYAWARVWLSEISLLPTLALRLQLPEPSSLVLVLVPAGSLLGLLAAVGPALWIARQVPSFGLQHAGRSSADRGLARARRVLIAFEVAAAIVLLVGATLFARSLDRLARADLGVTGAGLLAFDLDIEPTDARGDPPEVLAAEALRRARALPGVSAAAMANRAPVDTSTPTMSVSPDGGGSSPTLEATFNTVSDGYFDTVGTPILRGRAFFEGERGDVAIVNEALARRLWPNGDGLGRTLRLDAEGRDVQIVGIARDARYRAVSESGLPHVYLPTVPGFGLALLVKTTSEPRRMLLDVQDELDGIGPGVAGFFPRTHDDHLAIQLLPTRVASAAAGWFGGLALILCAMGLYGLIAWFVTLRQAEMALRLALGATRRDVERLVLRQAFATALPGIIGGVILSAAGVALARNAFYGLEPFDVVAAFGGAAALAAVVAGASWWPARQAGRSDPATALRST